MHVRRLLHAGAHMQHTRDIWLKRWNPPFLEGRKPPDAQDQSVCMLTDVRLWMVCDCMHAYCVNDPVCAMRSHMLASRKRVTSAVCRVCYLRCCHQGRSSGGGHMRMAYLVDGVHLEPSSTSSCLLRTPSARLGHACRSSMLYQMPGIRWTSLRTRAASLCATSHTARQKQTWLSCLVDSGMSAKCMWCWTGEMSRLIWGCASKVRMVLGRWGVWVDRGFASKGRMV